ncbi:MAG: peptidoglycan-binding domain-containing protein [Minicystis sp.]
MKDDGLDCLDDPFIKASGPPVEDPFLDHPLSSAPDHVAAPAPHAVPPPKNAPLAGQAELIAVAAGRSALRRGARGAAVRAVQEALIALGIAVSGGIDGAFGPGLERAVKELQGRAGLTVDGVVGGGTLRAIDAGLDSRAPVGLSEETRGG